MEYTLGKLQQKLYSQSAADEGYHLSIKKKIFFLSKTGKTHNLMFTKETDSIH